MATKVWTTAAQLDFIHSTSQWTRPSSSGATVSSDSILLIYSSHGADASQTIWLTTTPCRYGGAQTWFQCPCCRGRAAVLFMRAGRFACRQCQKISYTSQSGSDTSRGYATYHRLHALIAAGKPKWQRWATFQRLKDRFARADERAHQSLLKVIERLQAGRY